LGNVNQKCSSNSTVEWKAFLFNFHQFQNIQTEVKIIHDLFDNLQGRETNRFAQLVFSGNFINFIAISIYFHEMLYQ